MSFTENNRISAVFETISFALSEDLRSIFHHSIRSSDARLQSCVVEIPQECDSMLCPRQIYIAVDAVTGHRNA